MDERPMTVGEAADYLQVSAETVRRMLREGRLSGARLGGKRIGWRVLPSELRALIERGAVNGRGHPPVTGAARAAATLQQLRLQAERARARGDAEGAARFEAIAAGLGAER